MLQKLILISSFQIQITFFHLSGEGSMFLTICNFWSYKGLVHQNFCMPGYKVRTYMEPSLTNVKKVLVMRTFSQELFIEGKGQLKRQGAWQRAGRSGLDPGYRREWCFFFIPPCPDWCSYKMSTGEFPRG